MTERKRVGYLSAEMPGQSGVPIRKGFTMSDDSGKSKKLSLSGSKLTLGGVDAGQMRAGATGGARRTVQVEVRRKRAPAAPHRVPATPVVDPAAPAPQPAPAQPAPAEADAV